MESSVCCSCCCFGKTGKHTWCGVYSINNLWLLPLINKTATTWGVKGWIKVPGVGGRSSLKDRMCNMSSPLTDNLPSILVFPSGFCFWVMQSGSLGIVGGGGDVSSVARPVGVDEVAGIWQQFIRVGSKVVPLCLKQQQQQQQCSRPHWHISCPNRNDLRISPEKSPWTSRYSVDTDTNKVKAAQGRNIQHLSCFYAEATSKSDTVCGCFKPLISGHKPTRQLNFLICFTLGHMLSGLCTIHCCLTCRRLAGSFSCL